MGSFSEEDQFFDTKEYITPVSDSGSEGPEVSDSESRVVEDLGRNFGYEIWIRSPGTISERRQKLLKLMGLAPNQGAVEDDKGSQVYEEETVVSDRIMEHSGAVLRSRSRDSNLSSQSSISYCSSETQDLFDRALDENLVCRIKNLDDGSEFIVDELGQDGLLRKLREVGSDRLVSGEEFERILGTSSLVQRVMRRDVVLAQGSDNPGGKWRTKNGWLRRLGLAHVTRTHMGINKVETSKGPTHNIRVRTYRKRSKEFSALSLGQDIIGHEGAILTMKFSPDGQLLASAGEDGVVRIWQVTESERSNVNIPNVDQSHVYFTINHLGELVPINVDKEKRGRLKSLRKSSESTCVIFPQKVFQLQETPLHEFRGHQGEVLDLSWSNNKVGLRLHFRRGFIFIVTLKFIQGFIVFSCCCSVCYHLQLTRLFVCGEWDLTSA